MAALLVAGCATYRIGERKFSNKSDALGYQKELIEAIVEKVKPRTVYGGKLALHIPPDDKLIEPPFVTGTPNDDQKIFFLAFWKQDFDAVQRCLIKSNMFTSVDTITTESPIAMAKEKKFDLLLVKNADFSWTLYDLKNSKDKMLKSGRGLISLIDVIEDSIQKIREK
jgi:hypothetical protein